MRVRASQPRHASILQAAADGHIESIQSASDEDLKTAICLSGCTVLHYAAGNNRIQVLEYLLTQRLWNANIAVEPQHKAHGRAPLHYACRNGCLEAVQYLIHQHNANANIRAKHGVTPLQMAVWRVHLSVAQYLVLDCQVDPFQTNDFECGLVHWLGIAPLDRAGEGGERLMEMARWLVQLTSPTANGSMDFHTRQRQGHSILHKAVWQGHEEFVQYLHEHHDIWDDEQDMAGNFAADLADMANTCKHARIAKYLREHCSKQRAESCRVLKLTLEQARDPVLVKKAYRMAAKQCHPDRQQQQQQLLESSEEFHSITQAYRHLIEEKGVGKQCNPAHSLNLMLQLNQADHGKNNEPTTIIDDDSNFFKARLTAALLEYGDEGVDLSNVKKKWKQVWPCIPFPKPTNGKSMALSDYLQKHAGDVITIQPDEKGCLRVYSKSISREQVHGTAQHEKIKNR